MNFFKKVVIVIMLLATVACSGTIGADESWKLQNGNSVTFSKKEATLFPGKLASVWDGYGYALFFLSRKDSVIVSMIYLGSGRSGAGISQITIKKGEKVTFGSYEPRVITILLKDVHESGAATFLIWTPKTE